jgi:cytochrome P450
MIRINPDELHCNDPAFTDEIYAGGNRVRDKWQHFLNTGATGPIAVGSFSTALHESHRVRKGAMARFFSRGQMLKLESEVHTFTQRVCDKMLRTKGPFDLKEAFNCYTADIISQYSFGEPMGFVDQEGWEPNFAAWVKSFFNTAYMMRHVAPARFLVAIAPLFADYLGENMKTLMNQLNVVIPGHIRKALDNRENGRIFADLIDSNILPESDKTIYRLSGEGFNLLSAGTETTAVKCLQINRDLSALLTCRPGNSHMY